MCKGARCLYGHTPPTGKSAKIDTGKDDTLLDQVGATLTLTLTLTLTPHNP